MAVANRVRVMLAACCALLVLSSCSREADNMIDLTGVCGGDAVLPSDSLFRSVRFIPLETRPECMVGGGAVFAMDSSNILVWTGNSILRFGADGRFLNRVGRFGKGHGEHGNIISANYDAKKSLVYIGVGGNVIYKYSIGGDYVGRLILPDSIGTVNSMKLDSWLGMVCEVRDYKEHGLDVYLVCVSDDGKVLARHKVYSDRESVKVSMHRTGMLKNTSRGVMFMLPYSDKVFTLNHDGTIDSLVLYRGDHSPSRADYEDWDNSSSLYRRKYLIENIAVTDKRMYLLMVTENRPREVIVDTDSRAVVYNRSYGYSDETSHIRLSGFGRVCFWPWMAVSATEVADMLPIERFQRQDQDRLRRLSSNGFPLDAESNPVVVVASER